jgi:hypothetical protein
LPGHSRSPGWVASGQRGRSDGQPHGDQPDGVWARLAHSEPTNNATTSTSTSRSLTSGRTGDCPARHHSRATYVAARPADNRPHLRRDRLLRAGHHWRRVLTLTPASLLDTRVARQPHGPLRSGIARTFQVTGLGGVGQRGRGDGQPHIDQPDGVWALAHSEPTNNATTSTQPSR